MAHLKEIYVNGTAITVMEFDHTAQEIDDAVDRTAQTENIAVATNYDDDRTTIETDTARMSAVFTLWPLDSGEAHRVHSVSVKTTGAGTVRFGLYSLSDNGDGTGVLTLEKVLGDAAAETDTATLTIDGGYYTEANSPVLIACSEEAIIALDSSTGMSATGLPYFDDANYYDNAEGDRIACGLDSHTIQFPAFCVNYDAVNTTTVEEFANDISARVKTLEAGNTMEIPVFDLAEMGVSAIAMEGGSAFAETDTADLFAALNKGAVTFAIPLSIDGASMTGYCTMHSFTDGASMHQCVGTFYTGTELIYLVVVVNAAGIQVMTAPFTALVESLAGSANQPPTAIDLTAYESDGVIVETYADGSTITYTMEFDADGNPTKITDSDGNVTVLTW